MAQTFAVEREDAARLLQRLDDVIAGRFPRHPFETGITPANFEIAINQFVAMSVAFPYVQAGAVYENYRHCIDAVGMPDLNAAITAAIGTFLAWDEFGGHHLVLRHGARGLLKLLEVDRSFHSELLLRDIKALAGAKPAAAKPAPVTRAYLERLHDGLSCSTGNRNVAYMVGFERHAMAMITALWNGLKTLFGVDDINGYAYFRAHIGTDTPGEAVHVEMTESMIARLVGKDEAADFLEFCVEAYDLNFQWCQDVLSYANALCGSVVVGSAS